MKYTFLLATYNGRDCLERAVESILQQTLECFRVLIVDDGSDVETKKLLEKLSSNDRRVSILQNVSNKGLAFSLNRGIIHADTEYIVRMDDDDYCHNNRLEELDRFLRLNPKVDILGSAIRLIDPGSGEILGEKSFPLSNCEIHMLMPYKTPFCHPTVVMKKSTVLSVGGYNEDLKHGSQDVDLWFRLYGKAVFANLPNILLDYTVSKKFHFKRQMLSLSIFLKFLKREKMLFRYSHLVLKRIVVNLLYLLRLKTPNFK